MEECKITSMFSLPRNTINGNQRKDQEVLAVSDRRAYKLAIGFIVILLGVQISTLAAAEKIPIHNQVNTFGIKLGMTISEARAVMESQGGKLDRAASASTDWKYYFSYTASLDSGEDKSKSSSTKKTPANSLPAIFRGVKSNNSNSPRVTLYTFPTAKGRTSDPDTLVIYAMQSLLVIDQGRVDSLETFVGNVEVKYGPPKELFSSGRKGVDFTLLPSVSTGTSYTITDLLSNDAHRRVHSEDEICSTLKLSVLAFTGRPLGGPSVMKFNNTNNVRLGTRQVNKAKLTGCGEVTRISLRTNAPAGTDIQSGGLIRYSYTLYEKALKSFAECKKKGVASCVYPDRIN
jgi:hypothetical protein